MIAMNNDMQDTSIGEGDMEECFNDPIDEREDDFFDKKQRDLWKLEERLRRRGKKRGR